MVTSKSWDTNPIPLQLGVYQGDPLTVVIFNSVMSTLPDAIIQYQHMGYNFSQSPQSTNILQYADDRWTGMKAKVPKCHSLAIQASSGKTYDPGLMLQGEHIPSIGNNAVKFLGAYIQVPGDTVEKVDAVPVTRQQKLLLYRAAI